MKRDAVILAAARAFRRHGYHNTSLDDIATALHITKPTIYRYVSTKEEILFECFRTGLDRIKAAFVESGGAGVPASERLAVVVRRYAEAIASDFGWCMVNAEDQDLSPGMGAQIRGMKAQVDRQLRQLIRDGIQEGSIADCDVKMTAFALAGALNWIPHWHREGASLSPAEIADRFMSLFELGLRPR